MEGENRALLAIITHSWKPSSTASFCSNRKLLPIKSIKTVFVIESVISRNVYYYYHQKTCELLTYTYG